MPPFRIVVIYFILVLVSQLNAAVIVWGNATDILDNNDILATGSLVEAFNATGSSKAGNTNTVNGVTFTSTSTLLNSNTNANNFSNLSVSTEYDALLSSVDFGNGSSHNLTLGGGNLVVGQQYTIQVWYVDTRNKTDDRVMTFGDGNGNTVNLNDQYAIGTFVADGTNQTLSLLANSFDNVHISAYQIRLIPEPTVTMLTLLATVLPIIHRKRKNP